jgi:choline dehydrogenase-like flavoprotein
VHRGGASSSKTVARSASNIAARGGSVLERADADQEVLVTSGAIGSPRVLMLSGLRPPEHLRSLGVPVMADLPASAKICRITSTATPSTIARSSQLLRREPVFETGMVGNAISPLSQWPGHDEHRRGGRLCEGRLRVGHPGHAAASLPAYVVDHGMMRIPAMAFACTRTCFARRAASASGSRAPILTSAFDRPQLSQRPGGSAHGDRGTEICPRNHGFSLRTILSCARAKSRPGKDIRRRSCCLCSGAKIDYHPVGTCKAGVGSLQLSARICG